MCFVWLALPHHEDGGPVVLRNVEILTQHNIPEEACLLSPTYFEPFDYFSVNGTIFRLLLTLYITYLLTYLLHGAESFLSS